MKKLLCVLAAFVAFTSVAIAQENESEKVRLDIVVADSISTNLMSTVNTTNLGVRFGFNNSKVGVLLGGMVREGFCTADIDDGFPLDYYISANPYVGIELWNAELLGGVIFAGDGNIAPYVSAAYNIDLIKPTEEDSSRLSLKLGVEYFWDQFTGEKGARKDESGVEFGAAVIDVFSTFIPKASIGLQYTFGWDF